MSSIPTAPVIDVSPLASPIDEVRDACVDLIVDTVARTGTFVAIGLRDGAPLDDLADTMLHFFDLDRSEKHALSIRRSAPESPYWYRGYFASEPERRFSYVEYFDVGPDRDVDSPDLPFADIFAEPNHWPTREPCAGWRGAMTAYFTALESFATDLFEGFASRFGLPADEVHARFDRGNSTLRIIRYPLRPEGVVFDDSAPVPPLGEPGDPPMAIGRHTDGCCLSLLWQREPGLQGQAPDGTWYEVPRAKHGVSVHLGDMIETLTAGRMRATPHRVLERHAERCSIGFFLEPKLTASCEPVGHCAHPDNPALDSYAALLLRRFSRYTGYEGVIPSPD